MTHLLVCYFPNSDRKVSYSYRPTMQSVKSSALSAKRPLIIGMLHLKASPSAPRSCQSVSEIEHQALTEAKILVKGGVDGLIVENMHDLPYCRPKQLPWDTVTCMSVVCSALRKALPSSLLMGVQVLSSCNTAALAVAHACGLNFIRCEGYIYAHIGDEGYVQSCAADLQRYRKNVGAQHIDILTDIKKKHSAHAITGDVSLETTAETAEFMLSDGLIVTGEATGKAPLSSNVSCVKEAVPSLPVFVGSGVTVDNVHHFLSAHGLIIGSHFKHCGVWNESVDPSRVHKFMDYFNSLTE